MWGGGEEGKRNPKLSCYLTGMTTLSKKQGARNNYSHYLVLLLMLPKTSPPLAFFTKSIKGKKKGGKEDGQMEGHTDFLIEVSKT